MKKFINKTDLVFTDISSERWRTYTYDCGNNILIEEPLRLHVSENGHRIFDNDGVSHYIPKGWKQISWMAKEGEPNFVK